MKESYWGYWIILLGIFVVIILMLVQNITSNNTEDYYTINSITEEALYDAIDYSYYTMYGELKIDKEKFIESFLRRFVDDQTSLSTTYTITFAEIYETPPYVSIEVTSKTNSYSINSDSITIDITNRVDGLLEYDSSGS